MSGLKPCPFQKEGETHDVRFVELKPGYGQIGCADCEFWFPSEDMLTFEEAKARWNTRHERTCRVVHGLEPVCSECGEVIGADQPYCSECGAKVMER